MAKNLYSIEIEQSLIATLLQYPETYVEIPFINSKDFSKQNSPIFAVISNIVENKGRPDEIIVAEKLKSLGITLDGIEVGDYCSSLKIRPVDKRNAESLAKELKLKTLQRTIFENAAKVQKEILGEGRDAPKTAKEMIDITDKYLGESLISISSQEREAKNLLEELPAFIEEMGNPLNTNDFINMPYKTWNDIIGPLRPGQIYMWAARQGSKKSTLLLDITRDIAAANPDKEDLAVLYLDTEMNLRDSIVRYVAGNVGCPSFLLDSHKWKYSKEWAPKINAEVERIQNLKHKNIWFEPIGNMGISEMEKFVKRWKLNKCGRSRKCVTVYDYLKLNNNDKKELGKNDGEHSQAYSKIEIIKDLADWMQCPWLSALQQNRSGDILSKAGPDDSSASNSLSDRIGWLVAVLAILRGRTPDEMMQDSTPEMKAPSNKMIFQKTRYLWEHGPAFLNYVKVKEGKDIKYVPNFMNFEIENFKVKDEGTYDSWLIKTGRNAVKVNKAVSESKLHKEADKGEEPAF
jgi:replicative DNA helicase